MLYTIDFVGPQTKALIVCQHTQEHAIVLGPDLNTFLVRLEPAARPTFPRHAFDYVLRPSGAPVLRVPVHVDVDQEWKDAGLTLQDAIDEVTRRIQQAWAHTQRPHHSS